MRFGFTTGSCAAAAAKAAAYMLLTGHEKTEITIETPKKITYHAKIEDINRLKTSVSCAVLKDGGDDPDVTTGALIYAEVSFLHEVKEREIVIDGGQGVGRVTKKGLDQPVGAAAINRVPREMIYKEVMEVISLTDYFGGLKVVIFVPRGEEIAKKTFNPRLGIIGGISILGTSGVVEPMSSQAILDTIYVELRQRRALGYTYVAISPGNYGQDYLKATYGFDLDRSIKCSNFIGQTIDMAAELGFTRLLLTGHIGKLIKVAGGIMNTHSKEGDARMELLSAFAVKENIEYCALHEILSCVTTEEAIAVLLKYHKLEPVMEHVMERICFYLDKRALGKLKIDCILYSNEYGELAKSAHATECLSMLVNEQKGECQR